MEHMDYDSLHQLVLMRLDLHTDFETVHKDCWDSYHHSVMVVRVLEVSFAKHSVNYKMNIHWNLVVVPMIHMDSN